MVTTLSAESANWVLPSEPAPFTSTLPNYDESLPIHVNREGVANYVKNRGTLNLGDWATEARRIPTPVFSEEPVIYQRNFNAAPPPKVHGAEAIQNYTRSRSSTPNLLGGYLQPPNPHHQRRVKTEAVANYEKNQNSQLKVLFGSYGKLPLPAQPLPHTQGEMATNNYYVQQKGHMGSLLNNYGHNPVSARPIPHVKGEAAANNLQKNHGVSRLLQHDVDIRPQIREPNVKGAEAHTNYEVARGSNVNRLFHEYGKLPLSARGPPKVKYDGVQNFIQAQGDAMRKTLSQKPPSTRYLERPQSAPLWP